MAGLEEIDETKPADDEVVPNLPARQREMREQTIEAFESEHHLAGNHKIRVGDNASRISPSKDNQIYYNTEVQDIQRSAGGAWVDLGFFTKKIKYGSYVGNGGPSQSITGVGFQPDIVLIFPTDHAKGSYIKTPDHTTVISTNITIGATSAEGIQSLDADGFGVGSEPNDNLGKYGYVALKVL